jgi:putative ABC transport system permease protein
MQSVIENFRSALHSLTSSWLRTILTMLGILIGVGSVGLLISIALGVQKQITEEVQGLGTNLVFVVPGKLDENMQANPLAMLGVSTLNDRDIRALSRLGSVAGVTPFLFVGGTAEYHQQLKSAFVLGTTAAWFDMRPRPMAEGRLFKADEENEYVCVLAQGPREALFGSGPAIGETIAIQGVSFRVIGVFQGEPRDTLFGDGSFENMIFLPAAAVQSRIQAQINRIVIQTNPKIAPELAIDEISVTLQKSHEGRDDFGVLTQKQILRTIYRLIAMATSLLTGISAISLVVAGIGIMNIMLVTVSERTHEIGIRKAVGARKRDIFLHFLMEALVISMLGGTAGVATAAGLCVLVQKYSPLHPLVTPGVIAMAFGVCVTVGVVFGTLPALRAARMDPIAALRHE